MFSSRIFRSSLACYRHVTLRLSLFVVLLGMCQVALAQQPEQRQGSHLVMLLSAAHVAAQDFAVTVSASEGGQAGPAMQRVSYGERAHITLTPAAGFEVSRVRGCHGQLAADKRSYVTDNIVADCNILVDFALADNHLLITANSGFGGSVTPRLLGVPAGGSATFQVNPQSGFAIAAVNGCNGQLEGNTYRVTTVHQACTIEAKFSLKQYTVSTAVTGGGQLTPATQQVAHGSTASVHIEPNAGYGLAAINGCGGKLEGRLYSTEHLTASCEIAAQFSPVQYQVTVLADAHSQVSPTQLNLSAFDPGVVEVTTSEGHVLENITGCDGAVSEMNAAATEARYQVQGITGDCQIQVNTQPQLPWLSFDVSGGEGFVAYDSSLEPVDSLTPQGRTNLHKVLADGQLKRVVTARDNVKVVFTQFSPDHRYLFVALGWQHASGVKFNTSIARHQCALYRVELATNESACVTENVLVAAEGEYNQRNVNAPKPLVFEPRFDESGNWVGDLYFIGQTFRTGACEDYYTNCVLLFDDVSQLYRVSATGEREQVVNGLRYIYDFYRRDDGGLFVYGLDTTANTYRLNFYSAAGTRKFIHRGNVYSLALDDGNGIIYSTADGLQFATVTVHSEAGEEQVAVAQTRWAGMSSLLSTEILHDERGNILAKRGAGVSPLLPRTAWQNDSPTALSSYPGGDVIGVYGGQKFTLQEALLPNFQRRYVLTMAPLDQPRQYQQVPELASRAWLDIRGFRQQGQRLYVDAVDRSTQLPVVGYYDLAVLTEQPLSDLHPSEFSQLWTASERPEPLGIKDSEWQTMRTPIADDEGRPTVRSHIDRKEGKAISLAFSQAMDWQALLANVTLTQQGQAEPIALLPIQVGSQLHLLPDSDGLDNNQTGRLPTDTYYDLSISPQVAGRNGEPLDFSASPGFDAAGLQSFYLAGEQALYVGHDPLTGQPLALAESADVRYVALQQPYDASPVEMRLPGNYQLADNAHTVGDFNVSFWATVNGDNTAITVGSDTERVFEIIMHGDYVELIYPAAEGLTSVTSKRPSLFNEAGQWLRFEIEKRGTQLVVNIATTDGQHERLVFMVNNGPTGDITDALANVSLTDTLGVYLRGTSAQLANVQLQLWDTAIEQFYTAFSLAPPADQAFVFYPLAPNHGYREPIDYANVRVTVRINQATDWSQRIERRFQVGRYYELAIDRPVNTYLANASGCGLENMDLAQSTTLQLYVTESCSALINIYDRYVPSVDAIAAGDAHVTLLADHPRYYKANGYVVYWSTEPLTDMELPAQATGVNRQSFSENTPTITGLTNGQRYYFKVAALFHGDESPLSEQRSVTPAPLDTVGGINDTGQLRCVSSVGLGQVCPAVDYPGQDAEFGRDTRVVEKIGFGQAGFDVTKLKATGHVLPSMAEQWACTRDNVTGLVWQHVADTQRYTWDEAQAVIDSFNQQQLCGVNNWRLPQRNELLQLGSFGDHESSYQRVEAFRATGATWTAETVSYDERLAWRVYLQLADKPAIDNMNKMILSAVKGVSGQTKPQLGPISDAHDRFVLDDSAGLVTDRLTGLMWSRCALGQQWRASSKTCTDEPLLASWPQQLAQVRSLSYGGYSDWRMPNVHELVSLLPSTDGPLAISDIVFPIGATMAPRWLTTHTHYNGSRAYVLDLLNYNVNESAELTDNVGVLPVRFAD